jgi:hypothetical protein
MKKLLLLDSSAISKTANAPSKHLKNRATMDNPLQLIFHPIRVVFYHASGTSPTTR